MTNRNLILAVRVAALSVLMLATAAQAQQVRFVSSTGDNANDCFRETPCRTLQRGIDAVPARGTVHILDSGAYGQNIAITKSVNVIASGVAATIGLTSIDAADGRIALRGLHFSGRNNTTAFSTLFVGNAASVLVENCDVEGTAAAGGEGMRINAANTLVTITGSTFRDNPFYGLIVTTASGGAQVVIDNSRFVNNGVAGIHNVGPGSDVSIERSVMAGNGNGVFVGNGATVRVSNSTVVNNNTGLINNGGSPGTLLTRGNNTVNGNTTNTSGGITPLGGT